MVIKKFQSLKKRGMPHFLKTSLWKFSRNIWQTPPPLLPLLWWQTIRSPFENNDNRMGTKNFQSPHFVPFRLPPCVDWNFSSCHKDGQLKKFDWPILWQLKIFSCQCCGAPQFFNCLSLWWSKLFSHHRRGTSKAFQKHMTHLPFLATKNIQSSLHNACF